MYLFSSIKNFISQPKFNWNSADIIYREIRTFTKNSIDLYLWMVKLYKSSDIISRFFGHFFFISPQNMVLKLKVEILYQSSILSITESFFVNFKKAGRDYSKTLWKKSNSYKTKEFLFFSIITKAGFFPFFSF